LSVCIENAQENKKNTILSNNTSWIVKRYGKYGRKPSWIVKGYGKYGRKVSWNVKWYEKYGRKPSWIVKRFGKLGFLPYFSYLFTIQLAFLPYCPYLFTIQLALLPYFPYHFTFFFHIFPDKLNSEKIWKIQITNKSQIVYWHKHNYNKWQRPKVKLQFMSMNRKHNNMTLLWILNNFISKS
jgi:hypothetical protein